VNSVILPKVLVTDASERAALAVIRSLGEKGIDVVAGDSSSFNAGFISKYCKRRILYPSPKKSKSRFIKAITHLVKKENFDLIIPVTDFTGIPISEYKEELETNVRVAAPNYATSMKAFDKAQSIEIASKNNIPHPQTHFIEEICHVKKLAAELEYPVVIKPRTSIIWLNDQAFKIKVTKRNYAFNKKEFVTKYYKIVKGLGNVGIVNMLPLVQEYVDGTGYGVEALIHNSKPIAVFVHKRLREYPITGGASTLRVSIKNEKLSILGLKVLKAMKWEGVAMVEFKGNEELTKVNFVEVNGRFWGSLPLAIAAGVDFPYLLYQCIINGNLSSLDGYFVGVKKKWLVPGEFLWFLSSVLDGKNVVDCVNEFMGALGVSDDIFELSDPMPFFGALKTTFYDFFGFLSNRHTIEGETKFN
jgi:predicted ATP-grasp superfamily ATP-dependent carboligase